MSSSTDHDQPRAAGRARRIMIWLVTGLIALVLLLFAISNTDSTVLRFWPLPFVLAAPLYLVSLILLIGGFLIGHFIGWLGQARWRRAARRDAKRVAALEQELASLRNAEPSRDLAMPASSALVAASPR